MDAREIGTYTGCTHGPNGERHDGCIPCALAWHTRQHVLYAERAEHHLAMARKLEDEQIARTLDRAEALSQLGSQQSPDRS